MAEARIGLTQLAENQFEKIRHAIGNARVVLIGEETHGTQEFYALRAEITKALVERENFSLVLCESDFPTFYKLHQFVGGTQSSTQTLTASPSDAYSATSSSNASSRSPPRPNIVSGPEPSPPSSHPHPQHSDATAAEEVMEVLKARFPAWMWRNEVVRDFVQWLQAENLRHEVLKTPNRSSIPVALFGLDIYSMFSSTDQVISYLEAVDPPMAERARQRYGGLHKFRPHEEAYCRALLRGEMQPQNNKIKAMLKELDVKGPELKNVFGDGDEYFSARENARIVLAAEEYYRESYFGSPLTWNIRDHAMVDMIMNALAFHDEKLKAQFDDDHTRKLEPEKGASKQQHAEPPKSRAVVWAHNSHIGDAAATEQYERWGQVNIGHLVRQVLGKDNCFLIGLSTNTGTVRAAKRWNGRDFVMDLNPALPGSTGDVLHQASKMQPELKEFGLFFRKNKGSEDDVETGDSSPRLRPEEDHVRKEMEQKRLERFIGVQYVKPTERQSHYSMCSLSNQFDLMIHLDETSALRPLPELTEPKAPPSNLRPGTVDCSKRDKFVADEDDDEERA